MENSVTENQSKGNKPRKVVKIVVLAICGLAGLAVIYAAFIFLLCFYVFPTRTVQILHSPDNTHKAVLKRLDGIDLNFWVIVDGQKVYSSPDFAPNRRLNFRERITWDKTGRILILEVAGRRLFGYSADARKALSDAELMSAKYTPESNAEYAPEANEWEYGFEGEWPEDRIKKERQN